MARLRGVLEHHPQQGHAAADLQPCTTSAKASHHPLYQIFVMQQAGEFFLWECLLNFIMVDK